MCIGYVGNKAIKDYHVSGLERQGSKIANEVYNDIDEMIVFPGGGKSYKMIRRNSISGNKITRGLGKDKNKLNK